MKKPESSLGTHSYSETPAPLSIKCTLPLSHKSLFFFFELLEEVSVYFSNQFSLLCLCL